MSWQDVYSRVRVDPLPHWKDVQWEKASTILALIVFPLSKDLFHAVCEFSTEVRYLELAR